MLLKIKWFAYLLFLNFLCIESKKTKKNARFINAYGQVVLDNINKIESPLKQIAEYKNFIDKITEDEVTSTVIIMFSYIINQLRKRYPNNADLKYIANKLPREVVDFPFHVPMNIYSDEFKQFVCVAQEPDEFMQYKIVSLSERTANCLWNISVINNGTYFGIENIGVKQFLYALDTNEEKRTISMIESIANITDLSDKWKFKPISNETTTFFEYQIMNYKWEELITRHDTTIATAKFSYCETNNCFWRLIREPVHPTMQRKRSLASLYARYKKKDQSAGITLFQYATKSTTRLAEYIELFNIMKSIDGFYTVTGMIFDFNIQHLLKAKPYNFFLLQMSDHFRTLWFPFPWNRRVTIQNESDKRYICTDRNFMGNDRLVMNVRLSFTCYWIFDIDPNDFYMKIKSVTHKKNLEAATPRFFDLDAQKRQIDMVSGRSSENRDRWQLVHMRTDTNKVSIKNTRYSEWVYSYSRDRPATIDVSKDRCTSCNWLINDVGPKLRSCLIKPKSMNLMVNNKI